MFPVISRSLAAISRRLQVSVVLLGTMSCLLSVCILRTRTNVAYRGDDYSRTTAGFDDINLNEIKQALQCHTTAPPTSGASVAEEPQSNSAAEAPKQLIIMTYQRSGSTFFGNIFSRNLRDVFYTFEPVDSFYSAMYGTLPGWNVPSDITAFENGTKRLVPETESRAVASFVRSLLTCEINQLPTETLMHRFWLEWLDELPGSANYISCLRNISEQETQFGNRTMPTSTTGSDFQPFGNFCYQYTIGHCGKRFGTMSPDRLAECHQLMTNASFRSDHPDPDVRMNFSLYIGCMETQRSRLVERGCLRQLRESCLSRRVRVTKVVRLTMPTVDQLLKMLPNLRVVHLVRDPRATVLSRLNFDDSGRSQLTKRLTQWPLKIVSESTSVCNQMTADFRYRQNLLDASSKRRIVTMRYEDVVSDPIKYTRQAYNMMGLTAPCKVSSTMIRLARRGNRNVSAIHLAAKWKTGLNVVDAYAVSNACAEVLDLLYRDSRVRSTPFHAVSWNLRTMLNRFHENSNVFGKV